MNEQVCYFILQHSLLILLGYMVLHTLIRTAVLSLPPPNEQSSQGYLFLYTFLNAIFRNVDAFRLMARVFRKALEPPNKDYRD